MNELNNMRVYIWGAGVYGKRALEYSKDKFSVFSFVDERAGDGFKEYYSIPVITKEELSLIEEEIIVIIAMRYPSEVWEYLLKMSNAHIYVFDGSNTDNLFLYKINNNEICCPEYFDKVYDEYRPYSEHYSKQNPFIQNLFNKTFDFLKENPKESQIIEIGCGSGLFANMLFDNGYINYIGMDFSSQAIDLAKKANVLYSEKFACKNAIDFLKKNSSLSDCTFVLLEVLEHINNDRELLELIPNGCKVIFTVPNFKSFNHLRVFNNLGEIENRYTMLKINRYLELPSKVEGYVYHLCEAIKECGCDNEDK